MSTFRQMYEGIEKTFWNSLTKKLFSFLLLFAINLGYLVIWQDRREAVEKALAKGTVAPEVLSSVVGRDGGAGAVAAGAGAVLAASQRMREAGILAVAIRPPTVPAGTSRLRFSLGAAMSDGDLQRLLAAVAAL